ncbi:hypothetical protein F2Q70_00003033 [Brassica cretica]|uniref:Transmembrane protein n=1 Tax=Brassica cretica TaxID=69181 RepID=A0A8S9IYL0_BRACR|nr:hypothetical protein F2Q70_00003033 [Brassica cretica]KAF3567101.1 hypothetical protein DY000_02014714 [Brassica cretica]
MCINTSKLDDDGGDFYLGFRWLMIGGIGGICGIKRSRGVGICSGLIREMVSGAFIWIRKF